MLLEKGVRAGRANQLSWLVNTNALVEIGAFAKVLPLWSKLELGLERLPKTGPSWGPKVQKYMIQVSFSIATLILFNHLASKACIFQSCLRR
jgi:hypothetical protein